MEFNLRWLIRLLISCCCMLLLGCSHLTEERVNHNQTISSPYSMPAGAYIALAKQHTGAEQQALLLMAAGRLIQDGSLQQARSILTQLTPTSSALFDEKKILLAKIAYIQNRPRDVLTFLAQLQAIDQLPVYYQAQFHELLAQAYQLINNPAESINERLKLEAVLTNNTLRANNRRALWLSLTQIPPEELTTIRLEATDNPLMRGWVELALIAQNNSTSAQQLLTALMDWRRTYPNHPGNSLIPASLENLQPLLHNPPQQIALLLPLTGNLAGPGLAIKEGFLAGFYQQGSAPSTELRVYDTNRAPADALYQQALQEGAEFIIGPLTKTDVAQIAPLPHPVPTLLLNEVHTPLHGNTYQFGLSPLLEAQQIAVRARKNGLSRALVIAPAGSWGSEVARVLIDQWHALGGHVQDTLAIDARTDSNSAIQSLLHLNASEARAKRIRQWLGHAIESTPNRRQDFDVIFLIAYPNAARQIKPLLNYYYAGNVPIYALSTVYSGTPNTTLDRDLNGIIFPDMPWVFTHPMVAKHWPEQFNSYNRLYALGLDSFALTHTLNQLIVFPAVRSPNGVLFLSTNQQIARIPDFAQFKQGLPVVITPD